AQGHRCLPGLYARAAQERSRRLRRHLQAQGGIAAPGQPVDLSGPGGERAVQGNPGAVMAGPSDQDKLSEDWGLDDVAASAPAPDAAGMSEEERAAAAAAEWTAMLEGGEGEGEGGAA